MAEVRFEHVRKQLRPGDGDRGPRPHHPLRRVHQAARPLRLRQVDDIAHAGRARSADQRHDQRRRPGRERLAAGQARHRHGVPVLRALSAHDGGAEHRIPAEEARRRRAPSASSGCCETAALLQIDALLERKPRQLSGGQQQRVALGRALVRDPAAFLLDEPLSNLDAKLRAHMRAELMELHQRIGKTMVYVTHDQLEAMTMSDPHRGDGPGARCSSATRRDRSTTARPTPSSPASSARRR